ncbi:ribosome recycling factor [Streptomyces sp. NBC_01387]|uniref:ribosome recycling factor n=1 Tax=Streptomyces sp. NBC_01387 TaxID=2903849 RepID=UPI00386C0E88
MPTPLGQMAAVTSPEPRLVLAKPYQADQLRVIDKAIRDAGLGLNPSVDASFVRVHLPVTAQERRLPRHRQHAPARRPDRRSQRLAVPPRPPAGPRRTFPPARSSARVTRPGRTPAEAPTACRRAPLLVGPEELLDS